MNKTEIKKQLLEFTIHAVDTFLEQHPSLEFYSFAFDCHAENGEVNLCFNTETAFEKTLNNYQTGKYSQHYQSEEQINGLKYNTGDWEYQCFDGITILTEEELEEILGETPEEDDYTSWRKFIEQLNELFCECLLDFSKTETFMKTPKTSNFIAFCIDHDEDLENAIERLEKVKMHYT